VTPPAVIATFLDAARRGDPIALNALIDWPISGVGKLVRSVHDLDRGERADAAGVGLRHLLAEGSGEAESFPLGSTVLRLAQSPRLRPATIQERSNALSALQVPPLPSEIDATTAKVLRELADRAASVSDFHVVDYDTERTLALGLIPGQTQIALVRKL